MAAYLALQSSNDNAMCLTQSGVAIVVFIQKKKKKRKGPGDGATNLKPTLPPRKELEARSAACAPTFLKTAFVMPASRPSNGPMGIKASKAIQDTEFMDSFNQNSD